MPQIQQLYGWADGQQQQKNCSQIILIKYQYQQVNQLFEMELQQNTSNLYTAKSRNKLSEFVSKHKCLLASFQDQKSIEMKFKTMKNMINLLNPHAVKSTLNKKGALNEASEGHESEEIYFRQLNKMCEGQEQFDYNKKEEQRRNKKGTEIKKKYKPENKSINTIKKQPFYSSKPIQKMDRKFVELPNFASLLMGCSAGYAGMSTQVIIRRKVKKFKQNLSQSAWGSGDQNANANKKYQLKNQHLKQQIKQLKQKAKALYELEFEQFDEQKQQKMNQNYETYNFYEINQGLKEEERGKQKNVDISHQIHKYDSTVPKQLMAKCRQKIRPYSVGFNKNEQRSLGNFDKHYFRV